MVVRCFSPITRSSTWKTCYCMDLHVLKFSFAFFAGNFGGTHEWYEFAITAGRN